jgi:hypothetical protein
MSPVHRLSHPERRGSSLAPALALRTLGALALVLVLVGLVAPPAGATPASPVGRRAPAGRDAEQHIAPVDAPVVDGFRAPATPYGPGNRGLEYATAPGQTVVAPSTGTVVFAGQVAGALHVTVLDVDGIRSTCSFLATIAVHEGDRVVAGDPIGTTADHLFFSVRVGDQYVDPTLLLAMGRPHVRLVPETPEPAAPDAAAERRALAALTADQTDDQPDGLRERLGAAVGWARDKAVAIAEPVASAATDVVKKAVADLVARTAADAPIRLEEVSRHVATAALDWLGQRGECTPSGVQVAPPPGRHIAVLVAGLGSSSTAAAIDQLEVGSLGFAPADVVRFSYQGGRIPDAGGAESGSRGGLHRALPAHAYTAADTLGDLHAAGERLLAMLDTVARAAPGVPIDVIAHSQGGIVTRVALAELATRPVTDRTRQAVDRVVSLGAPYKGANLAGLANELESQPVGRAVITAVRAATGAGIDPSAVAVRQLAPGSALQHELERADLPAEIPITSLAARGDVVVPAPRARLAGATNVVVSVGALSDHNGLPGSSAVRREVALALAGRAPACQSLADAVADAASGFGIDGAESSVVGIIDRVTPGP